VIAVCRIAMIAHTRNKLALSRFLIKMFREEDECSEESMNERSVDSLSVVFEMVLLLQSRMQVFLLGCLLLVSSDRQERRCKLSSGERKSA